MNNNPNFEPLDDDLLEEYDLSQLSNRQRGKYAARLEQGYSVTVYHQESSETKQYVLMNESMIRLEPDVKQHFPDSKSVNEALRTLIQSMSS